MTVGIRLTDTMRMKTSDHDLVQAANRGDGDAFSALLSRHYDAIHGLAFRMLGSAADADDLAQDICAVLPYKLRSFRSDANFTTWLYRIVVNAVTDRFRKQAAHRRVLAGWGDFHRMQQDEAAHAQNEVAWLYRAMSSLPDDLRQTVALVLGEELTHAQAAQLLEVSEGTVSWRMSEVRKSLRAIARDEEKTL